jgi:hypothetical protein
MVAVAAVPPRERGAVAGDRYRHRGADRHRTVVGSPERCPVATASAADRRRAPHRYLFLFKVISSAASLWGYGQYAVGARRRWK